MYKTIKILREVSKIKQCELADKAGINSATLCSLEKGERINTSTETFAKIAKVLGLKPSELMLLCEFGAEGVDEQVVLKKYCQLKAINNQSRLLQDCMVGKTLKAIRVAEEQDITSLALILGTDQRVVKRIEMGEMKPPLQMVKVYLKTFSISEEQLYNLFELETRGASFKKILAEYLKNQD